MTSRFAVSDAAAVFDGLAADFFAVWFRFHPDIACAAGVGGFSQLLPAQTDDELAALAGWLESLIVALEEFDFAALDRERRIDLELMFAAARVEHQELHQRDWRRCDPLRFLPTGEIYRLTLAPPRDLRGALVQLLSDLPQHLRLAESRLIPAAATVAREMAQAAIDEAEMGRCYLRELARSVWLRKHCHGWNQIDLLADDACSALVGFADMLRAEVVPRAAGGLGCGHRHLRFLLRHRHFIDCDPLVGAAVLDRAREETDRRLRDLCDALGIASADAAQRLEAVTVDGRTRLESYNVECERLHGMLGRGGIVTLPQVPLHISERPDCPRPHRLGDDYVAAWDDERSGTLFLASQDPGQATVPDALVRVRGRCLSRTWGGAHLLTFAGGEAARRLPRRVASGSSLTRGWDIYLRERLGDGEGYGASPEERLHGLLHRRALILSAELDLGLHTGQLSGAEVLGRLEAGGLDRSRLVRLVQAPGDALAGVLGWQMISAARRLLEHWQGRGFSERTFHDRLIGHGPIPLPLVLRHELGADFWDDVRGAVLG
jgi:uncharacterized protein (DUF885 family)